MEVRTFAGRTLYFFGKFTRDCELSKPMAAPSTNSSFKPKEGSFVYRLRRTCNKGLLKILLVFTTFIGCHPKESASTSASLDANPKTQCHENISSIEEKDLKANGTRLSNCSLFPIVSPTL